MWGADLSAKPEPFEERPVWVDLDVLYGPPPPGAVPQPDGRLDRGLVLTGRVPGLLRRWARSIDGRWVGLVDFTLSDPTRAAVLRLERMAVPAAALTKMDDTPPRR